MRLVVGMIQRIIVNAGLKFKCRAFVAWALLWRRAACGKSRMSEVKVKDGCSVGNMEIGGSVIEGGETAGSGGKCIKIGWMRKKYIVRRTENSLLDLLIF